jgi:hypothetical protein
VKHDPPEDATDDADATTSAEDPAFDEANRDRLAQLSSVLGAPTTGRVVLDGQRGVLYEADPDVQHPRAGSVNAKFAGLGYEALGGLLSRRFQRVTVRGFARPGGSAYGLLLLPSVAHRAVELLTSFADGTTLLTSTNDGPGDKGLLLRQHFPGLDAAALEARHRERVSTLLRGGKIVRPTQASLEAFAGAIDDLLVLLDG